MKPVQDGGGEVAQWGVAMGKQVRRLFGEPGGEEEIFGRFEGGKTILESLDR